MTHVLPFLLVPLVAAVAYFGIHAFKAAKARGDVPPANPGLSFGFPTSDGVHYVETGFSAAGKSQIAMTYEIVADRRLRG